MHFFTRLLSAIQRIYTHTGTVTDVVDVLTDYQNIVFSGGHYAPKAYIATFNQFALTECDVNINDKSYASDGVCMLSD